MTVFHDAHAKSARGSVHLGHGRTWQSLYTFAQGWGICTGIRRQHYGIAGRDAGTQMSSLEFWELSGTPYGRSFVRALVRKLVTMVMRKFDLLFGYQNKPTSNTLHLRLEDVLVGRSALLEVMHHLGVRPAPPRLTIDLAVEHFLEPERSRTPPMNNSSQLLKGSMNSTLFFSTRLGTAGMPLLCSILQENPSFIQTVAIQGYLSDLRDMAGATGCSLAAVSTGIPD